MTPADDSTTAPNEPPVEGQGPKTREATAPVKEAPVEGAQHFRAIDQLLSEHDEDERLDPTGATTQPGKTVAGRPPKPSDLVMTEGEQVPSPQGSTGGRR